MPKSIIGFYHAHGYNIHVQEDGELTECLCEAGNSPHDSTTVIPTERGESLETLAKWCEQTGKELAEEHNLPWAGCKEETDPYEGEV